MDRSGLKSGISHRGSLLFAAGLAVVFLFAGWRRHEGIAVLREERTRLEQEAERLGIPMGNEVNERPGSGRPRTRRLANDPGQVEASELIDLFARMKARGQGDSKDSQKIDAEVTAVLDRLIHLDDAGYTRLIADLAGFEAGNDERRDLLRAILIFGSKGKQELSLSLAIQHAKDLGGGKSLGNTLSPILSDWANEQPQAALAWLEGHSEFNDEKLVSRIVRNGAGLDPVWALDMVATKKAGDLTLADVGGSLASDEARTAMIEEVRRRGKDADLSQVLSGMGRKFAQMDFSEASAWMDKQRLAPEEASRIAEGLATRGGSIQDRAGWLPWMIGRSPEVAMSQVLPQWINEDYVASGEWIRSQQEGPVKTAATARYVVEIAGRYPEDARKWAMTLPPGEVREGVLQKIAVPAK